MGRRRTTTLQALQELDWWSLVGDIPPKQTAPAVSCSNDNGFGGFGRVGKRRIEGNMEMAAAANADGSDARPLAREWDALS
jgi:hypothetical protein